MSDIEMGSLTVRQEAIYRDQSGRFLAEADLGAKNSARELALDIASLALIFAPKRSRRLAGTIDSYMTGATSAVATAGGPQAPYAGAQEKGARRHVIEAAEGPHGTLANAADDFFSSHAVMHPGNPATRFLERAGRMVGTTAGIVIRKHMPGL